MYSVLWKHIFILYNMKTFLIYSRTHHGVSGNSRHWYDKNPWVEIYAIMSRWPLAYGKYGMVVWTNPGLEGSSLGVNTAAVILTLRSQLKPTEILNEGWKGLWKTKVKWLVSWLTISFSLSSPISSIFFHHEKAFPALPSIYIQVYSPLSSGCQDIQVSVYVIQNLLLYGQICGTVQTLYTVPQGKCKLV